MGHFYDSTGELHAYVIGKNGQARPTTLADARKEGWAPSVTQILSDLNKEQLNQWRVGEGIKVALGMGVTEVSPEVLAEVVKRSEEYRDWAASFGTAVHDGIAQGMKGAGRLFPSSPILGVDEIVDGFLRWSVANALVVNEAELSFYSSLGYGGTIDGLGTYFGQPCIMDWKTQDFGAPGDKNQRASLYDPEWPLQMAGYDLGLGTSDWQPADLYDRDSLPRISFVISRTVPGLVTAHQWPDAGRYDSAWTSLWDTWQAIHRWGPEWAPKPGLKLVQGGLL